MQLIVGISGATGAIFGIRTLEFLRKANVSTHLILSNWAGATIRLETSYSIPEIKQLASFVYSHKNLAAPISSGSFRVDGMIIAPCSMKTLAAIRHGFTDNLMARTADVIIKEKKKLVLLTREMPLSDIHLDNMLALSKMGVTILPPMPSFYNKPETIDDLVNHVVVRTLDQFGIDSEEAKRWEGIRTMRKKERRNSNGL